ncbi:hypothetical protein MC885_006578 [Smutsia gigantea]|nr:hypothetical protein MC885_006578 [Smutsia gigantea]
MANHTQARLSIQYNSSKVPTNGSPTAPVETTAIEVSKQVSQGKSHAQPTKDSSPHYQAVLMEECSKVASPSSDHVQEGEKATEYSHSCLLV